MAATLKITIAKLKEMKAGGDKIVGLTAWDFISASFADGAGADVVLVGDSLSMTIRGDINTLGITLDDMIYHCRMVSRGVDRALVIADMPFMSYQVSPEQALVSAGRFVKEAGAHAVKMEGGQNMAETVKRVAGAGIPVMGHIGLTPQAIHQVGGFKVQGKNVAEADLLIEDAVALEQAGIFALVLECLPAELAFKVTREAGIPTIGIGAGVDCDGQIQVTADVLGLLTNVAPRHARKFIDLAALTTDALKDYVAEVRAAKFPGPENSFVASEELKKYLIDEIS